MKILPWTIYIAAISISLIIALVAYTKAISYNQKAAEQQNEYAQQLEGQAAQIPSLNKKVEDAVQLRREAAEEWQGIVAVKTPPSTLQAGGIDLTRQRYQLVLDSIGFRNRIQTAINRQLKAGGVKVISGPTVPDFPDDPTKIIEDGYGYPKNMFPVRVYDFGRVTVQGSLAQIKANIEAWTRMPNFIAVTDGLTLVGTAPTLRGSYNLTVVMYVRASDFFPPIPTGAGGAPGVPNNAPGNAPVPRDGR